MEKESNNITILLTVEAAFTLNRVMPFQLAQHIKARSCADQSKTP